jgi:hypothetical protein
MPDLGASRFSDSVQSIGRPIGIRLSAEQRSIRLLLIYGLSISKRCLTLSWLCALGAGAYESRKTRDYLFAAHNTQFYSSETGTSRAPTPGASVPLP